MTGKEKLITDLFVVGHHCTSSKDRDVIRWVMNYIDEIPSDFEDYQSVYPECTKEKEATSFIGKRAVIISPALRLPKGTVCEVVQWINPELDSKNFYIRNIESDYCCWASSQDLQFL